MDNRRLKNRNYKEKEHGEMEHVLQWMGAGSGRVHKKKKCLFAFSFHDCDFVIGFPEVE